MSGPRTEAEVLRELTPTAEEAVIGSMLIDPACVGDVLAHLRPEDFSAPRLRALFVAARDLFGEGRPVDPVTVDARAGGGMDELIMQCMDLTPTAANVLHYCDVVRDQTALRRLHRLADELGQATSLSAAQELVAKASAVTADKPGVQIVSIQRLMADFLYRIAEPAPKYVKWGLGMLDSALHTGAGSYVLIGARPSDGKTALALQLAVNISAEQRVGFFSLETSAVVTGDRLAAANLDIRLSSIKRRLASPSDITALTHQTASSPAFRGDFDFISAASLSVSEIRSITLAQRYDVIFIDYVQLVRPEGQGDRTELMQGVSMALRAMAQLTGVIVVALAQLRRPDTQKGAKAPTMADLKESGQFEQDADAILLMYRENQESRASPRIIKIEKNKEGYAGLYARFAFDGEHQRFVYVDKDGEPPAKKSKFEEIDDGQMELPFE